MAIKIKHIFYIFFIIAMFIANIHCIIKVYKDGTYRNSFEHFFIAIELSYIALAIFSACIENKEEILSFLRDIGDKKLFTIPFKATIINISKLPDLADTEEEKVFLTKIKDRLLK